VMIGRVKVVVTKELANKILKATYAEYDFEFKIRLTDDEEFDYAVAVRGFNPGNFIPLLLCPYQGSPELIEIHAVDSINDFTSIGNYDTKTGDFAKFDNFWQELYIRQLEATHVANQRDGFKR